MKKQIIFFTLLLHSFSTHTIQKKIAGYLGPPCMMIGGFNLSMPITGPLIADAMGIDPEIPTKVCVCLGACCFFCGGKMIDYAKKEAPLTTQPKKVTFSHHKGTQTELLDHPHSE